MDQMVLERFIKDLETTTIGKALNTKKMEELRDFNR